eukprot:768476-Hanusia_phi.AAC.4
MALGKREDRSSVTAYSKPHGLCHVCGDSGFEALQVRVEVPQVRGRACSCLDAGSEHVTVDADDGEEHDEKRRHGSADGERTDHGPRLGEEAAVCEDRVEEGIGEHSLQSPDYQDIDASCQPFHAPFADHSQVLSRGVVRELHAGVVLEDRGGAVLVGEVDEVGGDDKQEDRQDGLERVGEQRRPHPTHDDIGKGDAGGDEGGGYPVVEGGVRPVGHRKPEADGSSFAVLCMDAFGEAAVLVLGADGVDDRGGGEEGHVPGRIRPSPRDAEACSEARGVLNALCEDPRDECAESEQDAAASAVAPTSQVGDVEGVGLRREGREADEEEAVDGHEVPL